jgi:hypothetical protein
MHRNVSRKCRETRFSVLEVLCRFPPRGLNGSPHHDRRSVSVPSERNASTDVPSPYSRGGSSRCGRLSGLWLLCFPGNLPLIQCDNVNTSPYSRDGSSRLFFELLLRLFSLSITLFGLFFSLLLRLFSLSNNTVWGCFSVVSDANFAVRLHWIVVPSVSEARSFQATLVFLLC